MAKLRQASLIMLLLLAVSSAALAETCTGGAVLNNTVPGQCSRSNSLIAKATCSASGAKLQVFLNASCPSDSFVYTQTLPIATCMALNGGSAVYYCDLADIRNTTSKSIAGVATPANVVLAPSLNSDGNTTTEGCDPTTGCAKEYASMHTWPTSNGGCTGNASQVLPATTVIPGAQGWYSLDTCYVYQEDEPTNTTAMMTCKGGKAYFSLYTGNCASKSAAAAITLNTDTCLYTPAYYYKFTCPSDGSSASAASFSALLILALALFALLV